MVLHNHQLHNEAKDRQWMLQWKPIPVVDKYTYLGLAIDIHCNWDTMIRARATGQEVYGQTQTFSREL